MSANSREFGTKPDYFKSMTVPLPLGCFLRQTFEDGPSDKTDGFSVRHCGGVHGSFKSVFSLKDFILHSIEGSDNDQTEKGSPANPSIGTATKINDLYDA
jgi:hypothetical protein